MKILQGLLYIFSALVFLNSCSTDFEPYILSKPLPVVYGVINPEDSLFRIRLTKSFIGGGDAYDYAKISDSLYYSQAQVFLITKNTWGALIDSVELEKVEIEPREDGIFGSTPNIIYQTDYTQIRLRKEQLDAAQIPFEIYLYLRVKIPGYDDDITSFAEILEHPRVINPRSSIQKVYFFGDYQFNMEWTHVKSNAHFEVQVFLNYKEILADGSERDAGVDWTLTGIQVNEVSIPGGTNNIYSYYFVPDVFYSHIRASIPADPQVRGRVIKYMDFIVLTSDGTIRLYNNIGKIADDYHGASYSNILNGLGLFSTYNTVGIYNLKLGQRELDSLAFGRYTKHLNFKNWY